MALYFSRGWCRGLKTLKFFYVGQCNVLSFRLYVISVAAFFIFFTRSGSHGVGMVFILFSVTSHITKSSTQEDILVRIKETKEK